MCLLFRRARGGREGELRLQKLRAASPTWGASRAGTHEPQFSHNRNTHPPLLFAQSAREKHAADTQLKGPVGWSPAGLRVCGVESGLPKGPDCGFDSTELSSSLVSRPDSWASIRNPSSYPAALPAPELLFPPSAARHLASPRSHSSHPEAGGEGLCLLLRAQLREMDGSAAHIPLARFESHDPALPQR